MVDCCKSEFDIEIIVEIYEVCAVKLISIIHCYVRRYTKSVDDPLPDETN